MNRQNYRQDIEDYIRLAAQPPDKFSHQPRLYAMAKQLAEEAQFDDDVLHAAAWLHDLGVFVGHRPADPAALAKWDNVAYAAAQVPRLLRQFGFPEEKIAAVIDAVETHMPSAKPMSFESKLLHDADILEQLGAVGVLRTVCKIGRDTRFIEFEDAVRVLRRNCSELPEQLQLDSARRFAGSKLNALKAFLGAADAELASAV